MNSFFPTTESNPPAIEQENAIYIRTPVIFHSGNLGEITAIVQNDGSDEHLVKFMEATEYMDIPVFGVESEEDEESYYVLPALIEDIYTHRRPFEVYATLVYTNGTLEVAKRWYRSGPVQRLGDVPFMNVGEGHWVRLSDITNIRLS
jgi:hypothetical protein